MCSLLIIFPELPHALSSGGSLKLARVNGTELSNSLAGTDPSLWTPALHFTHSLFPVFLVDLRSFQLQIVVTSLLNTDTAFS